MKTAAEDMKIIYIFLPVKYDYLLWSA